MPPQVLYTFSILFNILLDAAVAGYISYRTAATRQSLESVTARCSFFRTNERGDFAAQIHDRSMGWLVKHLVRF